MTRTPTGGHSSANLPDSDEHYVLGEATLDKYEGQVGGYERVATLTGRSNMASYSRLLRRLCSSG